MIASLAYPKILCNNGEEISKYPVGSSFLLGVALMQGRSTNQAHAGPGTSSGSQPERLRRPASSGLISLLVSCALVTTLLTGGLWFIGGIEGAVLGGFIAACTMIIGAAYQLLLPTPASQGPKSNEESLAEAEEPQRHPNGGWPLRVLRWIIWAKAGLALTFVGRATGRRRSAVVAGAIVGAATEGCFELIIHTLPELLRLRAIQDAVIGAATFALFGAVLGALVDRLAAPFIQRFEERSFQLKLTCGAVCGAMIGGLSLAVFGIGVLTMLLVMWWTGGRQVRWENLKVGEMVFGVVVFPVTWGVVTGAISGLYAAKSGSANPPTIKVP